ncbi:MAG: hypothetical protein NTY37_09260 [Methanothrix sp.]|nr:hypothetical protein [Methanothrix sp.]
MGLAGQRTLRRCLAWDQGRAVRCKHSAGSCGFLACAPLRITAPHRSPAAMCHALAEILP